MPYDWNIENPQVIEEYEQTGGNNASAGCGTRPTPKLIRTIGNRGSASTETRGASYATLCHLKRVEGGDRYGLEEIDLCLVLDVGLLADFKTTKVDKYKGSSYPRLHLAMYCRKMEHTFLTTRSSSIASRTA
ncbi:hypothetical protein CR513_03594, partial [Mucuna pruriens]